MSYLRRVCMAASVAAVEGQTDKGSKWKSSSLLRPSNSRTNNKYYVYSMSFMHDSSYYGTGVDNNQDDGRKQAQDSLLRVMYLNCWAHQS
ncbi:hypothetical protein ACOSQ2_012487 [Xanthoceras sorbifolium]